MPRDSYLDDVFNYDAINDTSWLKGTPGGHLQPEEEEIVKHKERARKLHEKAERLRAEADDEMEDAFNEIDKYPSI